MLKRIFIVIVLVYISTVCYSQTLGGNAVFNFLSQPNTAQLSALGGVNISSIGNDVGMAFHNPALLRNEMHQQVNTSFNSFLAGINQYGATAAFHIANKNLNLGVGVQYLNYGTLVQADASGNVLGNFRPNDYVVQMMVSKKYNENFWIGATAKYIQSNYGMFRSNALAMDIGLLYFNKEHEIQASLLVKNLGTQLATYNNDGRKEELPFDVQAGISKKLKKAPLQFSLTAHNLQRLNIYYNDTTFSASEGGANAEGLQKVFAHLVLSTQVYLSENIELNFGYNFLRRQDLNVSGTTSGLNGFTLGTGILIKKLQIRYGTGFYQRNMFHQISLNFNINGNALSSSPIN